MGFTDSYTVNTVWHMSLYFGILSMLGVQGIKKKPSTRKSKGGPSRVSISGVVKNFFMINEERRCRLYCLLSLTDSNCW